MWIGVLSDTYGKLDPQIMEVFDGVDFILHCGNIGDAAVVDTLSHCAPVSGVLGGSDQSADYEDVFAKSLHKTWFDIGIYVTHRIGDPLDLLPLPRREIEEASPEVVLFGHSHETFNERVEGRHFLNPGAATRRRGGAQPSVALLELDGRIIRGEIVPLGSS